MAKILHKRLAKEIQSLATNPPPGVKLEDYQEMTW